MKLHATAVLLIIAAFVKAGWQPCVTPRSLYTEARLEFDRGHDQEVLRLAEEGMARFGHEAKWHELFTSVGIESLARTGDRRGALKRLDRIPLSGDPEATIWRLIARGYAQNALDAVKSEGVFAEADALATRFMPAVRPEIAIRRAGAAFYRHDDHDIERFATEALQRADRASQPYVIANARGMLTLLAVRRREYGSAIENSERGMSLARALNAYGTLDRMLGNAGWAYMQVGESEQAKLSFEESVRLARQLGDLDSQWTHLGNLAAILLAEERPREALSFAQESVRIAAKRDKPSLAMALSTLAQVEIDLGEFAEARRHNAEAQRDWPDQANDRERPYTLLNAARVDAATGRQADAIASLSILARSDDLPLRWNAQAEMARIYESQGRTAEAERMYEAALDTGDEARADYSGDSNHLLAFESLLIRFYDRYIELLRRSNRARDALLVAERSRARTLRQGRPLDALDPVALSKAHGATLLSYWISRQRSLLWIVTPEGISLVELPAADVINREVDAYRDEIVHHGGGMDSVRAARLFQWLVTPALPHAKSKRFIIVPDGRLGTINFESLIVDGSPRHYWIEDATVSSAPSLSLIPPAGEGSPFRTAHALLIGDIPAQGLDFPALPLAKAEIADIRSHFGSDRCEILTGAAATRAAYLNADLSRFAYVHFAAHGTASIRSPLESSVILAGTPLSAKQIIQAPLKADLVTISSCNSAGRRTYVGEGPVGLAWAFLRAGARRVVASQWDVSDRATSEIMSDMYGALATGRTHADALREAKLGLVKSRGKYSRPFYWAPFILYGAP